MDTRSQSRNNFPQQEASPAIVEPLHIELPFLEDQFQEDPPKDPPEVSMADNRIMAELLQAPTEGYEDAIVIPEIAANNFELKHGLINLVQNKQFFRHDKEDPHAHIPYFNKITSTMRVTNVPSSSIKLMLFPFSPDGFFPPSKTTNLRNEITRFQQRFDESFYEAWDHFNELLRACPHHGFSKLHQFDTFYNALNVNDQDSLNSAAGGILHRPQVNQPPDYQALAYQAPIPQTQSASKTDFESYVKANDAVLRNMQNQGQRSGTLLSDTITNPKENLKGMDECLALADLGASINLMPLSVWEGLSLLKLTPTYMTLELADRSVSKPIGIAKDVSVKVGVFHFPADFVVVDFELDPQVSLILESPTPYDDLIVSTTSPTLTPFRDSDFLLFEEADAFLGLKDDLNSSKFNPFYYDLEGDILLLEAILNSKPLPPFPNHEQYMPSFKKELKDWEAKTVKSSVDEPPEVKLKDLPPYLEYAFLECDNKFPVIIAKELGDEEKSALIKSMGQPVNCVPKKGGFTIVENEENELIPNRLVTGWRGTKTIVSSMVSLGIFKFPLTLVIKRKPHSHAYTERLPIVACLSVCAMHRARFKGKKLTEAPILIAPNWDLPFELMCHASDFAIGAETLMADHLSRLENPYENVLDPKEINETFPLETLSMVTFRGDSSGPWFADFVNYQAGNFIVKAKALPTNDARVVCKFLKSLFARFGAPQAIISDRGKNRASWSDKLDDVLWAFHTAYKTPIGCTPYKRVYGKTCHLLIELEHKAYWALKKANSDLAVAGDHRKVQLNELNEPRDHAYENSLIYKEKTKIILDSKIKNRVFNVGDRVLLFNSRLTIFSGKLKTRWSGPFTITKVFPYGTVELFQANRPNIKGNGHHLKQYFGRDIPTEVVQYLQAFLKDN
uniref:Retrotransposon gag domain-containing protein n=1 Tax=Tanacetum cinerariifolium TaxID=118510 RepID=A0A6L2MTQ5_TANCI|nr:hypothetical protein [Tanacetum cinerariifolium]